MVDFFAEDVVLFPVQFELLEAKAQDDWWGFPPSVRALPRRGRRGAAPSLLERLVLLTHHYHDVGSEIDLHLVAGQIHLVYIGHPALLLDINQAQVKFFFKADDHRQELSRNLSLHDLALKINVFSLHGPVLMYRLTIKHVVGI